MNEQKEAELFAIVNFIKDNALTRDEALKIFATKEDVKGLLTKDEAMKFFATKDDLTAFATKNDFREMESRLLSHIDGIAQYQTKFDQELVATRSRFERVEDRVEKVEEKVGI